MIPPNALSKLSYKHNDEWGKVNDIISVTCHNRLLYNTFLRSSIVCILLVAITESNEILGGLLYKKFSFTTAHIEFVWCSYHSYHWVSMTLEFRWLLVIIPF